MTKITKKPKNWPVKKMLSPVLISSAHTLTSCSHMQRVCVLAYVVWAEKKIKIRTERLPVGISRPCRGLIGRVDSLSRSSTTCHSWVVWSPPGRLKVARSLIDAVFQCWGRDSSTSTPNYIKVSERYIKKGE